MHNCDFYVPLVIYNLTACFFSQDTLNSTHRTQFPVRNFRVCCVRRTRIAHALQARLQLARSLTRGILRMRICRFTVIACDCVDIRLLRKALSAIMPGLVRLILRELTIHLRFVFNRQAAREANAIRDNIKFDCQIFVYRILRN